MRKFKLPLILMAALSCPTMANADSAGTTIFNFLSLDTNARAVAMGGAYAALAANSEALTYNPAGLAQSWGNEATFMHNQYFQDIAQEYLSYSSPKGWGASINYLNFGTMRETTLTNPTGTGLGDVGLTDMAFSFGYGKELNKEFSAGAGIKLVRETIAGTVGQGVMIDAGILYKVPDTDGLTLAMTLQNIGPEIRFDETNEPLPTVIRIGSGYRFDLYKQRTTISLDAQEAKGEDFAFKFGCEVLLGGTIPFRVGFTTANDDGPGISAGTGFSSKNLNFDYAYIPFKDLGNTHRFSVTFRWGEGT